MHDEDLCGILSDLLAERPFVLSWSSAEPVNIEPSAIGCITKGGF